MKRTVGIMVTGALIAGFATTVMAKTEKKTPPKNTRTVEELVKAAGEGHFPEKMKIRKVGSIKVDETYYHLYCGALKKGGFHAIVFDNSPKYLGYYKTEYEPSDYEEGAILLDTEDSDEEGNTRYEKIEIRSKGPTDGTEIDGVKVRFVKAPEKKETKVAGAGNGGATGDGSGPAFREWTITLSGKQHKVRAIYVDQTFGKVTLRAEASGKTNAFPISALSEKDKAYIKQFK